MEWRAHITDDFAHDGRRVTLYRRAGDDTEIITGYDTNGIPITHRQPVNTNVDFPGFLIPADALEAIAEAVMPSPAQGETKRLEDALAVERRRVDDLLARIAGLRTP